MTTHTPGTRTLDKLNLVLATFPEPEGKPQDVTEMRDDVRALLARCERLEAALSDALDAFNAQGMDAYADATRAAIAKAKGVTP